MPNTDIFSFDGICESFLSFPLTRFKITMILLCHQSSKNPNRSTQVLPGYCDSCLSFPQGHLYQGFNVGLYKFRPVVLIFVNECVISIYCYGHPVYDMVLIEALPMGQCCRYIPSIKTLK